MRGLVLAISGRTWRWLPSLPMATAIACGLFLLGWAASLASLPPLSALARIGVDGRIADSSSASASSTGGPAPQPNPAAMSGGPAPAEPPDPFVASGIYGMEPAAGPGEAAAGEQGITSEAAGSLDTLERKLPKELADVAAHLAEKEKRLEARRRELDVEEEVLGKLRDDLDGQITRLEELKKEIAGLLEKVSADEQARLAKLVAIYEAMKPKQAAAIFDRLDLPVLLKVARRMRETKLAPIFARMDPARARQVTSALSAAPELPKLE